jgi:ABC-type sugar transport system ATPase subunit
MSDDGGMRKDERRSSLIPYPSSFPRHPITPSPLLLLRGVTKRFTGVTALDRVDFDLGRGEIHALLGENGAGKSTLIKVLGGIHVPESGTIAIDGQPARIRSVADADRHGIRIIHQELSLAPNLSVAENVYLGREPQRLGWLLRRQMRDDAAALIRTLGLDEIRRVDRRVRDLSVAHQQLVEIARALSARARILVLDEPTSALSESETEALFATLRRLRSQGVGIIYISHRLEEVLRLADRITVLRDGRSIGTQPAAGVNQAELIRWMVGREIREHFHRPASRPGAVALEVRDLWGPKTFGTSFALHYGEILGIAGLVGSGRTELVRALFGIDPLRSGRVLVDGRPVSIRSPRDALACGMVLVPEDRQREGLVSIQSLAFNLALPWVDEWITACFPSRRRRGQIVDRAIRDFRIRAAGPDCPVSVLSGGNQQKTLVARWMHRPPKILLLDEPTRGVDVGAREEMFGLIGSLVESGMAVLLITSDLSEVMQTAHRILLYRDGRTVGTALAGQMTPEAVMTQLTGARDR